jgi:hypothetical protein
LSFSESHASIFVSTHAPTRGATDRRFASGDDAGVSTHAPVRGATLLRLILPLLLISFNPRTCTRCDQDDGLRVRAGFTFQPTHLHEVRLLRDTQVFAVNKFQPTHLHEVRLFFFVLQPVRKGVSTHAPARGATVRMSGVRSRLAVSTHAPARGATEVDDVVGCCGIVSTHAPARGATALGLAGAGAADVSTHAPARGATW